MTNEAVSLHFSKPQTSTSRSAFSGLPCKHLHLAACSSMDFICNHMMQFLIVDDSNKDVSDKFLSSNPAVEDFASRVTEAKFHEALAKLL